MVSVWIRTDEVYPHYQAVTDTNARDWDREVGYRAEIPDEEWTEMLEVSAKYWESQDRLRVLYNESD